MLTLEILQAICPETPAATLEQFVDPLNATFVEFGIEDVPQQQRFLAQVAHESGGFRRLEEGLNYSAVRLAQVWSRYAQNPKAPPAERVPNDLARSLARKPEAIANNVYANRMGNGDEASGDGWRCRGSGLIQATGAETHRAIAEHFGIPVEEVGAWMRTPEGGARSAGFYWHKHGLGVIQDFQVLTQKINGGLTGLADRYVNLGRAKEAYA